MNRNRAVGSSSEQNGRAAQLSRVFAALADPTRRDIVARLTLGDATVGELAAPYQVTLQAISKHLNVPPRTPAW